jgi:hypothetical protein
LTVTPNAIFDTPAQLGCTQRPILESVHFHLWLVTSTPRRKPHHINRSTTIKETHRHWMYTTNPTATLNSSEQGHPT